MKITTRSWLQHNALVWLVVSIGLLHPLAYLMGWTDGENLAKLTGASPVPTVFGQINGFEYWAAQYEFDFTFSDRPPQHLIADAKLFSQIKGPHVVHIAHEFPLATVPFADASFWLHPIQYALCNHGKIARDWHLEGDLKEVILTIRSKTVGHDDVWTRAIACVN